METKTKSATKRKTVKFVQFSPDQSVEILMTCARECARDETEKLIRMYNFPRIDRDSPPYEGDVYRISEMLFDIGNRFLINFDAKGNEPLANSLVAEYKERFITLMNDPVFRSDCLDKCERSKPKNRS